MKNLVDSVADPVGSLSGTVGAYEPRLSAPRRQQPWSGTECPNEDCGSTNTPVRTSGRDAQEHMLRERVCRDCGQVFTTIEQVVLITGGPQSGEPVKFALIDVEHRRRKRESKRRRFGWNGGGAMLRVREVRIAGVPRVDGRRIP